MWATCGQTQEADRFIAAQHQQVLSGKEIGKTPQSLHPHLLNPRKDVSCERFRPKPNKLHDGDWRAATGVDVLPLDVERSTLHKPQVPVLEGPLWR